MSDESFLRPHNREFMDEERGALVERLFVLAVHRVGSAAALARHLGLSYAELKPYLAGKALPPRETLWRVADLVAEDLKVLKSGFSEQTFDALSLPASTK